MGLECKLAQIASFLRPNVGLKLAVLSSLESMNAEYIQKGLDQPNRLAQLNQIAINQMKSLVQSRTTQKTEMIRNSN